MLSRLPIIAMCAIAACATIETESSRSELEYRCTDLVVVGRVSTVSSEDIPDSDFLPHWQGRYHLQIRIKRVVRGSEPSLLSLPRSLPTPDYVPTTIFCWFSDRRKEAPTFLKRRASGNCRAPALLSLVP